MNVYVVTSHTIGPENNARNTIVCRSKRGAIRAALFYVDLIRC